MERPRGHAVPRDRADRSRRAAPGRDTAGRPWGARGRGRPARADARMAARPRRRLPAPAQPAAVSADHARPGVSDRADPRGARAPAAALGLQAGLTAPPTAARPGAAARETP